MSIFDSSNSYNASLHANFLSKEAPVKLKQSCLLNGSTDKLRVMSWNIEGFGGGFRERVRSDEIMKYTAAIINTVKPDICVILEVMGCSRPRMPSRWRSTRRWP